MVGNFGMRQKLLFICSRNKQRSLTAETMLRNNPTVAVKSAGTENSARIKLTVGLIGWADLIVVMERKHLERLQQKYVDLIADKPIVVLNIPDHYAYMDEELIDILTNRLADYIEL